MVTRQQQFPGYSEIFLDIKRHDKIPESCVHEGRFRNATNHQSQYDIGGISRSSCFNKDDDGNGFVYSGHLLVPAYRIGCRGGRHNNHKE